MNEDPAKLSLSNSLAGESRDPLQAPPSFTAWMQAGAWAAELYEPELLAGADARTSIRYDGKSQRVINLCSYNYLGIANRKISWPRRRDALQQWFWRSARHHFRSAPQKRRRRSR